MMNQSPTNHSTSNMSPLNCSFSVLLQNTHSTGMEYSYGCNSPILGSPTTYSPPPAPKSVSVSRDISRFNFKPRSIQSQFCSNRGNSHTQYQKSPIRFNKTFVRRKPFEFKVCETENDNIVHEFGTLCKIEEKENENLEFNVGKLNTEYVEKSIKSRDLFGREENKEEHENVSLNNRVENRSDISMRRIRENLRVNISREKNENMVKNILSAVNSRRNQLKKNKMKKVKFLDLENQKKSQILKDIIQVSVEKKDIIE